MWDLYQKNTQAVSFKPWEVVPWIIYRSFNAGRHGDEAERRFAVAARFASVAVNASLSTVGLAVGGFLLYKDPMSTQDQDWYTLVVLRSFSVNSALEFSARVPFRLLPSPPNRASSCDVPSELRFPMVVLGYQPFVLQGWHGWLGVLVTTSIVVAVPLVWGVVLDALVKLMLARTHEQETTAAWCVFCAFMLLQACVSALSMDESLWIPWLKPQPRPLTWRERAVVGLISLRVSYTVCVALPLALSLVVYCRVN